MNYILETKHLTKKYGSQYAVKDINIHLVKGQIYGLVGRNGAGKTTLLRMLSGLSRPTDGTFEVFGKRITGRIIDDQSNVCHIDQSDLSL